MISQYDVKHYAKEHPEAWFSVDENDNIVDKETEKIVCTLEEMTGLLRKKNHCDFEVIYSCRVSLQNTIRCRECGTVIFATDDEYGYDPNLCCPTCGNYQTSLEYWTADEIESDEQKKKEIQFLEQMQQEQDEEADRRTKRGGKYDWQIWRGKIELWKRAIYFDLECDNLFRTKLKGLRLDIHWACLDERGMGYIMKKHFTIPLSVSSLIVQIHIHSKKWRKEHGFI